MSYEYGTSVEERIVTEWTTIIRWIATVTYSSQEVVTGAHLTFYLTELENAWGCDGEITVRDNEMIVSFYAATASQRTVVIKGLNKILTDGRFAGQLEES
jgi:hypothetical protein